MPFAPIALLVGLLFIIRSNLGGVVVGAVLTMGAMHLWPDIMVIPYEWIGSLIESTGLTEEVNKINR